MIDILLQYLATLLQVYQSDIVQRILSITGTALILYFAFNIGLRVRSYIKPIDLQTYCHSETGSWVLVTGASDGIGKAFSDELLHRGFNVLLHGRNPEKLARLQQELAKKYPRRSLEVIVADASKADDSYNVVVEKVKQLPGKLTILINNVGGIHKYPQYISHSEIPHENIDDVLNTNLRFPTHLTRALLPILKENGPAAILNCGSVAGTLAMPYLVTYTASKAFNNHFTESLAVEMAAEGITNVEVMAFMIGNVESAGNKSKSAFNLTSRQCAMACLDRVGCGQTVAFPTFGGFLQLRVAQLLPDFVLRKVSTREIRRRMEEERKGS